MITEREYFGTYNKHPDVTQEIRDNARKLLVACTMLEDMAIVDGVMFPDNPATHSGVSGGANGGFRPQKCPVGASLSSHKQGLAVDRYDPRGHIDEWCMAHLDKLEQCGIYIEHPSATEGWSHWTIKAPRSGNRVFYP